MGDLNAARLSGNGGLFGQKASGMRQLYRTDDGVQGRAQRNVLRGANRAGHGETG